MSTPSPHSKLSTLALAGLITLGIVFGLMTAPASGETNHEIEEGILEGQAALNFLNEQRSANGILPMTLNQSLATSWCPNEDAGPGSSEVRRDLSANGHWSADYSPWEWAPFHEFSEYSPVFTEAGIVNSGMEASEGCLGVSTASPEPSTPTFYAFVSPTGPNAAPPTEIVSLEGPFAPQEAVGIPEGTPTGPQLLLYVRGLNGEVPYFANQVHAVSWSLTHSGGAPVSGVSLVDERTATAAGERFSGCAGILAGGGILIPPPLSFGSYSLSVVWEGTSGQVATQSLSFTVAPQPYENAPAEPIAREGHPNPHKKPKKHKKSRAHKKAKKRPDRQRGSKSHHRHTTSHSPSHRSMGVHVDL